MDWGFETSRLRARLVDDRDQALYRMLYTSADVMAHIGPPFTQADADDLHRKVCGWNSEIPMRARYWRLATRDTDETIGMQSILRVDPETRSVELGLMILPAHQKMKYGFEVTAGILDRLFGVGWALDLDEVVARHLPQNARISKLGNSLGFDSCDLPGPSADGLRMRREVWKSMRARVGTEGASEHDQYGKTT